MQGGGEVEVSTPRPTRAVEADPTGARLEAGSVLAGRYRVGELLGAGSTGNVYAATSLVDGTEVALKVLHPELAGDRQVNLRFHREARILTRLAGHHIAAVRELGEDPSGLLFMALERIDGEPLDTVATRDRCLELRQVIEVMVAICEALEHAHAAGVIHRDLKPGNVMVRIEAGRVRDVRVLDFGLSKVLQGDGIGSTDLTEQNMVLGTPEYMAPEQARGDELDERCDIYAAGAILYELLAGTVPFRRRTPVAVMTAHLTDPPPRLERRPSGEVVPPALAAAAMHALAKSRRDRYPSARAFADALRSAVSFPSDVGSVRPPPPDRDSLPFRDTDNALGPPAPPRPAASAPPSSSAAPVADSAQRGVWIAIAALSAVVGIAAGVLLALRC
jgi:serine/threonine-protein kinase